MVTYQSTLSHEGAASASSAAASPGADPRGNAAAPAAPNGATAAMQGLAAIVEQAEALEAAGKYREAAELTAKAMTSAHNDYVQSSVPGVVVVNRRPSLAMPRRDYIERYKARLRVDWQKWERVSMRGIDRPGTENDDGGERGDADEEDDADDADEMQQQLATGDGQGSGAGARGVVVLPAVDEGQPAPSPSSAGPSEAGDWKPATLARQKVDGASGVIELVHTCCDGTRFVAASISCPDVPARACNMFNREQKRTVAALLAGDSELCGRAYTHDEIARWMLTASKLSKNRIGDYLGRDDANSASILAAFLGELQFAPFALYDEALRFFLSLFRLPGEAQQIDRIMQSFAMAYHAARPGTFTSADTAFVLAFSLVMLNTDAHSPQIEHKMSLTQFLSNNRGIDEGNDLPAEFLTMLYKSIVANEIRMEQREYIASDKEGWLLKQGGRWKGWRRRYTILSGNVLYYFKSPKDREPAGFVPLEGIQVTAHRERLIFDLTPKEGKGMKSVRMGGQKSTPGLLRLLGLGGKKKAAKKGHAFAQGHHKRFRFKVIGDGDHLDAWVNAVNQHAVKGQDRGAGAKKDAKDKAGMSFFRGKAKPGARPGMQSAPAAAAPAAEPRGNGSGAGQPPG